MSRDNATATALMVGGAVALAAMWMAVDGGAGRREAPPAPRGAHEAPADAGAVSGPDAHGGVSAALPANGAERADPTPVAAAEPILRITAERLARDYVENELRADARYKGRVLRVTGKVKRVGRDIVGEAYVILEGYRWRDVQIFAGATHEAEMADLSPDEMVVVTAKCIRLFGNVQMGPPPPPR